MIRRQLTQDDLDVLNEYLAENYSGSPQLIELRLPTPDAEWYFVFVNRRIEGVLCGD